MLYGGQEESVKKQRGSQTGERERISGVSGGHSPYEVHKRKEDQLMRSGVDFSETQEGKLQA